MIAEDWAGIMADLGAQIKTMLNTSGINPSQCPQPPRALQIQNAVIHLPEIPAVLSIFAAVRTACLELGSRKQFENLAL